MPNKIKRMTMKIDTLPKSGRALSSVFTSYLSLSIVVMFLNGYNTLKTLSDLRVVIFVIISTRLEII